MQPTVGEIIEGKVTGITNFGAFVALPSGKSGLVHISEVANTYVKDIKAFLTEGQSVRVKVISVDDAGRINLSIKQAASPSFKQAPAPRRQTREQPPAPVVESELSFEDKLKRFMQDSDSRITDSRAYGDKKSGYRRRRD